MMGQETLHHFLVEPDPDATAEVQNWLDSPPCAFPGRTNQPGSAAHWPGMPPTATLGESVEIYTETILNELCNRGLLPEGDLTIHAWW